MNGVLKELPHMRNWTYERVCGAPKDESLFSERFRLSDENTGFQKDQGKVNSCVAEVICQIAEEFARRRYNETVEMSDGFVYSSFRDDFDGEGMFVTQALDAWCKIGTCEKKYFDVLKEMPELKKMVQKFPELFEYAKKHPLSGYVALNFAQAERRDKEIKTALMSNLHGLLAVSDKYFGGSHAVLLVGWDDPEDGYIIKNSWGEDWGDNGFKVVPKSAIDAVYLPLYSDMAFPFEDVPQDAWYFDDVKGMYYSGLIKGVSDTCFEPERSVTRAELCAVLRRILKEEDMRNDMIMRLMEEKLNK